MVQFLPPSRLSQQQNHIQQPDNPDNIQQSSYKCRSCSTNMLLSMMLWLRPSSLLTLVIVSFFLFSLNHLEAASEEDPFHAGVVKKVVQPELVALPAESSAPPAELVASPAELVASPAESSAPPAELVAPPAELVAPPAELVASPAELVASPAESLAESSEEEDGDHPSGVVSTSENIVGSVGREAVSALTCERIPEVELETFGQHLQHSGWVYHPELVFRTASQFIKQLDLEKIYLLEGDVETIEQHIRKFIFHRIAQRSDSCSPLEEAFNLFATRFQERFSVIKAYMAEASFEREVIADTHLVPNPDERVFLQSTEEADAFVKKWLQYEVAQYMRKFGVKDGDIAKTFVFQVKYEALKGQMEDILNFGKKSHLWGKYLKAFGLALDPHTQYTSPQEALDFQYNMQRSLTGIGVVLQYSADGRFIEVVELIEGGGAATLSDKIQPKDKFLAIEVGEGVWGSLTQQEISKAVTKIRGPEKTFAHLKMRRSGENGEEEYTVVIPRKKIKVKQNRASMDYVEREVGEQKVQIGILYLPDFYNSQDMKKDFKRLLGEAKAEGVSGVILNLSQNLGGDLEAAKIVVGSFIKQGMVVGLLAKPSLNRPPVGFYDKDGEGGYYGPLIVLVSERSVSASEVVAAALKDYGRALIVGEEQTFGKGTAKGVIPLGQGDLLGQLGAMQITNAFYFTPSGVTVQQQGVTSDVAFLSLSASLSKTERDLEGSILPFMKVKSFFSPPEDNRGG